MYIELNPLDLLESKWKINGVGDKRKAREFLSNYKWKSKPKSNSPEEFFVNSDDFLEYINSIEVGLQ